ncbi:MAG: glutamyl-tRNA reductase [Parasporobacterium sp.]|nr:glutamyl-tRNA reductase [Parasporobacterium sp.]
MYHAEMEQIMVLCMAGIDHNQASLDVRSQFSFTKKKMEQAYAFIMQDPMISGCVLLSTCNRTEIWLSLAEETEISAAGVLLRFLNMESEESRALFRERKGKEAAEHLFRLTAGLESRILGEGQILTQTGEALVMARGMQAADHTLEVLFRHAVTAGKQVRTETDLSLSDRSVIQTALEKLESRGFSVKGQQCLVIGNGMMGRLSAETLLKAGAEVTVTVRKYHNGVVDIPEGCRRISYDERYQKLPECELVVSATSSPNYTITKEALSRVNLENPVILIDLAVPRDVEPAVSEHPRISLYDIDSFQIDLHTDKVLYNLEKAEQIIRKEQQRFYDWFDSKDLISRIDQLKEFAGEDVVIRMTPVFRHSGLDEESRRALAGEIKGASARMANHLLFRLKETLPEPKFREVLDSLAEICEERKKTWM